MKHFLFFLFTLIFVGGSIGQISYESPHVKDGKTIRFTIPKGYSSMGDSEVSGYQQFASHADIDLESEDIESLSASVITISHMPADDQTLESLKDGLRDEMLEDEEVTVMRNPVIEKVNGREYLLAAFMGGNFDARIERIYFGITRFGDYFINVFYFSTEGVEDIMEYGPFKDFLATWKEVATTKENALSDDEFYDGDIETNYKNDLFETQIDYLDILPDFGEEWDEPVDENSHLLSEFTYKKDNGSIKIFSGGQASNYPSVEEMSKAIERAMDRTKPLSLTFNSQFSNEDHVFKLYTISGGGTMSSVYTTEVNNELVFFVVDGGSNPVDAFKPAVRDFMLTMWVDYFDDSDE